MFAFKTFCEMKEIVRGQLFYESIDDQITSLSSEGKVLRSCFTRYCIERLKSVVYISFVFIRRKFQDKVS